MAVQQKVAVLRVGHIGICCSDLERSLHFYRDLLGVRPLTEVKVNDAASAHDLSLSDFLASADMIIHGSTVATNTLVERKGAKVGLITTDGFRDLLEMREGLKEDRYNLRMTPVVPLVPRYLRAEVPERVRADGKVKIG